MKYANLSCIDYVQELSSKSPLGGGSAAALAGALGAALAGMVCNLTTGKKKYAQYEEDIQRILAQAKELQQQFIRMMDEDAESFLPLSKAYGLPADTEEEKRIKDETLEKALKLACQVPVKMIRTCHEAIKLHELLAEKGSRLALSDVGVGVQCLRTAIISAQLNVQINLGLMKDQEHIRQIRQETESLVASSVALADAVYAQVAAVLEGKSK